MYITICGKRWKLVYVKPPSGGMGSCDSPTKKNKKIHIKPSLKGRQRLETEIHEFTHAGDWNKDEEWVEEFAHDLARILTRIGYRLPEE